MKVKIGGYISYSAVNFNALQEWYHRIRRPDSPDFIWDDTDWDWIDKAVDKIVVFFNKMVSPLNKLIYNIRTRKTKVIIHNYDVWNLDHTLSLIIVPALKRLKEIKHGSPQVDNADVPKELRGKKDKYGSDTTVHEKWDWALDEMIWAFEQIEQNIDGWEGLGSSDSYKEHQARIVRGTTLFGKYFQGLWD